MPLLKVNQIASYSGNTLTIGTTGDTVTLAAGSSVSGFGFDGVVWTSNIVTSNLTVSANVGYFVNTSAAAITLTLPASPSNGDQLIFTDYNRKFGTNNLTLNQNSVNFQGFTTPNPVYSTDGQTIQLVYADSTKGWIPISDDDVTLETPQSYSVDFLVIAGGGGGGGDVGGGGGAGGYRNSYSTEPSGGGGSSEASITFNFGTVYTITVGGGGAGGSGTVPPQDGINGTDSSISGSGLATITSTGGGGGDGASGGANIGGYGGGGARNTQTGAAGTANQGFAGGNRGASLSSGGGGGAGAIGSNGGGSDTSRGGSGGAGLASSITGSSVSRGGGGGGGDTGVSLGGTGGTGGGGNGGTGNSGGSGVVLPTAGTANTGGGGGGGRGYSDYGSTNGAAGGKGVVILRIPTVSYSGTTTGSPTVTTDGSDKVIVFNDSGSITG